MSRDSPRTLYHDYSETIQIQVSDSLETPWRQGEIVSGLSRNSRDTKSPEYLLNDGMETVDHLRVMVRAPLLYYTSIKYHNYSSDHGLQ